MVGSINTHPDFSLGKPIFKITSTPFGTKTSKIIGVKQLNTDLLNDKNSKNKDKSLTGFYF